MRQQHTQLPAEPDVVKALIECADAANWPKTRVAYVAGVSFPAMMKIYKGETKTIKSDSMLALMRALPGFADRLGFDIQEDPHSVAV